jgi:hypothetical protein
MVTDHLYYFVEYLVASDKLGTYQLSLALNPDTGAVLWRVNQTYSDRVAILPNCTLLGDFSASGRLQLWTPLSPPRELGPSYSAFCFVDSNNVALVYSFVGDSVPSKVALAAVDLGSERVLWSVTMNNSALTAFACSFNGDNIIISPSRPSPSCRSSARRSRAARCMC